MDADRYKPGPGETLDRLAGEWWIYQLARGHRYNTDDVLTAWTGWRAAPEAGTVLDLCAGVGAVGLLTLLKLPPTARLVSVEVQSVSAGLAGRSVAHNGLADRVEVRLGDLRDPDLLPASERYPLITANPPYLPEGSATPSPQPQRATARLELHGDVFDLCETAAAHLLQGGRFVFCFAASDPRPEQAAEAAGLTVIERREVIFRAGQPPTIALYTCATAGDRVDAEPLTVRSQDGQRTDAFRAVRRDMLIEA